jgi:Contractile injection system tube protein
MSAIPATSSLVKAYLEIKERPGPCTRGGSSGGGGSRLNNGLGTLSFRFNPKQYTIAKTSKWSATPRAVGGTSAPEAQHIGPEPRTLNLELFFDESDSPDGDVSTDIAALMQCCNPRESTHAPPVVLFGWGANVTFEAYVSSVSARYTMFRHDGTPYRAQNPTSGTRDTYRTHITVAGDSLASVAYKAYGDASRWREIAEANDIDDPMRLAIGHHLLVPPPAERAG